MAPEWQLYMFIGVAREKHFWKEIEKKYRELPEHELIYDSSSDPSPVFALDPATTCRVLTLLAINDFDKNFFGDLVHKVYKKEIDYCDKQGSKLNFRRFITKFASETPTTAHILRLAPIYIQMRELMGLEPDEDELLKMIEDSEFCLYGPYHGAEGRFVKAARDWYSTHPYKTLSDLQYDEKLYTPYFECLSYICRKENVAISMLEEYPITRQDLAVFFDAADLWQLEIEKLLPLAYLVKAFAKYIEASRNEYIRLFFGKKEPSKKYDFKKVEEEKNLYKSQAEQKQEKLNAMQLENDKLKREIEKLKQENGRLEDYVSVIESQSSEADFDTEDEAAEISLDIEGQNIVVLGGHDAWQNRLKKEFPNFSYIASEQYNFDVNIIRNADIIAFNFIHCSHKQFYRMRENVNRSKIVYISSNNINRFKQILSKALK